MGSTFHKKLAHLKQRTDDDLAGQYSFVRSLMLWLIIFGCLFSLFEEPSDQRTASERLASGEESLYDLDESWQQRTEREVRDRVLWLDASIFGGGTSYFSFARSLVSGKSSAQSSESEDPLAVLDFSGLWVSIHQVVISALLRIGFVVCALWWLWVLAIFVGAAYVLYLRRPRRTDDVLGVCDRGKGPFYSGIFAPLRPNRGVSGTDYSCPGLACPKQVGKHIALGHSLGQILKRFNALNETNTSLVRVILAYREYPSFVESERPDEDAEEPQSKSERAGMIPQGGITIEKTSVLGLRAVLEAHRALIRYHRRDARDSKTQDFSQFRKDLQRLKKGMSPLGSVLLDSLTPSRAAALAELPLAASAAGALAIEAGKSLVFKKVGDVYAQESRFPHLQARAVLQSIPSYHKELSGDERLIVRQAIVCSRRHGDFGRAFLPFSMPLASRALRDWLEILYAGRGKYEKTAHIVELDGHIEEVHLNWRERFDSALQLAAKEGHAGPRVVWKGLPYKSVVLVPLRSLVTIALEGIESSRQTRILELIEETRAFQASLSISARLPGFKRQAIEAEKGGIESGGVTKLLAENPQEQDVVDQWLIIRRMLTRYNWLSTRVGENAVPVDGIVQAILLLSDNTGKPEVVGLDALVPLRQRAFARLLGGRWERTHYLNAPRESDLEVFVENEEFRDTLKLRHKELKDGRFDSSEEVASA